MRGKKSRQLKRPVSTTPIVVNAIAPRLFNRQQASAYLGVSIATLDEWRAQGVVTPVPMPSVRTVGAQLRISLFDRQDLDSLIDNWKAGAK